MSEAVLPTSDGSHDREDLRLVEYAVRSGWAIPAEWSAKLPEVAARIALDPKRSDRDRLRALEVLRYMKADYVDGLIELIKTRRLIGGQSTENVTFRFAEGVDQGGI